MRVNVAGAIHPAIALHGLHGAGKTTLRKALQARGAMAVDFSGLLKVLFAWHQTQAGTPMSLEEVERRKQELYRALFEYGDQIGFFDNPTFVELALRPWLERREEGQPTPLVLDAVRTHAQAEALHAHGIAVVHLKISPQQQAQRAETHGLVLDPWVMRHSAEQPLPPHDIDLTVDADLSQADVLGEVVAFMRGSAP